MAERYRAIVADPPWSYPGEGPWGNGGTLRPGHMCAARPSPSSRAQYGGLSLADLKSIQPAAAAEPDAHLYLWTTNLFMVAAHELAQAWGFAPKTILTWTKTHHGNPSRVSMKTGYYFRGATEHCLFCVRGSLKLQTADGLPTAYLWPRLPHSVKPDAFYDLVEKASPGPYLELFARRARFGWDYWGDESLGTAELAP